MNLDIYFANGWSFYGGISVKEMLAILRILFGHPQRGYIWQPVFISFLIKRFHKPYRLRLEGSYG